MPLFGAETAYRKTDEPEFSERLPAGASSGASRVCLPVSRLAGVLSVLIMTYAEKLKDPRWQKKRLEILERDSFTCRHCGDKEKELHVHHAYYERGMDPWDYKDHMLFTLCKYCHDCIENEMKEIALAYVRMPRETAICFWRLTFFEGRMSSMIWQGVRAFFDLKDRAFELGSEEQKQMAEMDQKEKVAAA